MVEFSLPTEEAGLGDEKDNAGIRRLLAGASSCEDDPNELLLEGPGAKSEDVSVRRTKEVEYLPSISTKAKVRFGAILCALRC